MYKKTKIVATLGPASENLETMREMVKNGVNVFRLNFSHGTHEYHEANLNKIRQIEKELGVRIGILQDISGPKVRTGELKETFILKSGDILNFVKEQIVGEKIGENEFKLCINHPEILSLMKVGELIYLYDGAIRAKVIEINEEKVVTLIENDGMITSRKGVNFPNTRINIEVLTQKDKDDMLWGVKNRVNFVAISFVQNENDVKKARKFLESIGSRAKIYSKIEKFDAVENIDQIIENSDGIMVARGDLGIEVPFFNVPVIQKEIIKKANAKSRPVITATQMMLSMTTKESATRAEISDVANAVLDGTDAVMLSEESAIGHNPVAVVKAMSNTIHEIEKIYPYNKFDDYEFFDETDMIASSTARLASRLGASALITITGSGKSAIKMARNRTKIDIFAVTHDEEAAHSLTIAWGIKPVLVTPKSQTNLIIASAINSLYNSHLIDNKSTYVMTAGFQTGVEGSTNFIRIIKQDQIDYFRDLSI